MTDLPLTCEYCRTAPASCLMVVDFEYSRVKALVCQPCGERSRPDAARVAKAAWLFSLGAAFPPEPDENLPRQPLIHDLAIVLAGALHPGAQLTPGARLVASRLRDVLGVDDGDPLYGRELTGAKDIEAKLSAALGVTRISPPEDGD